MQNLVGHRKSILFFLIIILSVPTALAETITFSDIGMATEFNSGRSGTTPIGTFYSTSNDYPLEVTVNAYFRTYYRLIVYLNDEQIDSGKIIGNVNLSVTFKKESLKNGKNSIYIYGNPWGAWPFGVQFGNLIIYGNSKISSPDIFLPPTTPSPTPSLTPSLTSIKTPIPTALAETITFSDMGMATEFTKGRSASTPIGTFYTTSNEYPLEITVNAYYRTNYLLTIYLNDAPVKSDNLRGGSTLSATIPKENVKNGKNTIYITGAPTNLYPFGSEFGNLIIYGTSKISSPGIFLPPPTPTQTPIPTPTPTSSPTQTSNPPATPQPASTPSPTPKNSRLSEIFVILFAIYILFYFFNKSSGQSEQPKDKPIREPTQDKPEQPVTTNEKPIRESIPREVKMYVWKRDGGKCVNCGSNKKLEYDHIIPLSKGGSNTERNIQLLCENCNRSKGGNIGNEPVISKPSASVSLQGLKDELAKINELREELEETFINGEITEANYKELVEKYRVEADALKNQIAKKKFM